MPHTKALGLHMHRHKDHKVRTTMAGLDRIEKLYMLYCIAMRQGLVGKLVGFTATQCNATCTTALVGLNRTLDNINLLPPLIELLFAYFTIDICILYLNATLHS